MNRYSVNQELSLPEEANPRFSDLSHKESEAGGRIIGGDKGDLCFSGYSVENGKTILYDPELLTSFGDLTDDEVNDYANEILMESYQSIGIETVEHS